MAKDMENPDTRGRGMDMQDTRAVNGECDEDGCTNTALPHSNYCRRHTDG
jgi:hypothetical protein